MAINTTMAKWLLILSVLLLSAPLHAASPNSYRAPTCELDIHKLPIFNLSAKRTKQTHDKFTSNSSVVLIGKNLWRTTAHSIGYNKNAYIKIIAPHVTLVAKVILIDIEGDVAYLRADSGNLKPIPPLSKELAVNELVWNIGFPGLFDRRLMTLEGMFARVERQKIIVSAIGYGGMSGGATVRCNGERLEMVGTITAIKRTILSSKVWTDDKGVLHSEKIYVNSGYTIVAPIKE